MAFIIVFDAFNALQNKGSCSQHSVLCGERDDV
jgi:hypothetical protein